MIFCLRYLAAGIMVAALQLATGVERAASQPGPGVVVTSVAEGSAAAAAGIRPGDVLIAWVRPANLPAGAAEARGVLNTPFDLSGVVFEQAPRGPVTFTGTRDGQDLSVTLSSQTFGFDVRPQMPETVLELYLEGTALTAKELDDGLERWRRAAEQAQASDPFLAAWLLLQVGDELANARKWPAADATYEKALTVAGADEYAPARVRIWEAKGAAWFRQNDLVRAESAYHESRRLLEAIGGETVDLAGTLHTLGALAFQRGDFDDSEKWLARALAIKERLVPDSATLASTLNLAGVVMMNRGRFDEAAAHYARSLAIRERLAPDSSAVAQSLDNLANLARRRGDLGAAERYLERALAIDERRSPDSLDVASSVGGLARVSRDRGDLHRAEELYRRALAIQDRLSPDSLAVAESLHNIGEVLSQRGDLVTAEDHYRRALGIRERVAGGSLQHGETLQNLGTLATRRGDFNVARDYLERALAIYEKRAPNSLEVASALNNLGSVALAGGDVLRGKELKTQALAIRERLSPDSLAVAISQHELGRLEAESGNVGSAGTWIERALAIQRRLAPDSLTVAETLSSKAMLAERSGDLKNALALRSEALQLFRTLAPGSIDEALTLHRMGTLTRAAGEPAAAEKYFAAAVTTLEAQMGRFGGAEDVKSRFGATYASLYRDFLELLLDRQQPDRAFDVLERSRARTLLAMLGERDLLFTTDLPPELARQRRTIDAEYDRTQAEIARLQPGTDRAKIDRLLARLRELRDTRESLTRQIRLASPRLAALHYPQPLDLAGVRATLDPGTVLLSYAVAKERTTLFVVQAAGHGNAGGTPVASFSIPIGEGALREEVSAFRRVIQRQTGRADPPADDSPLRERGMRLFDLLIAPARPLVDAADRVLIAPDGVLHSLPFAALIDRPTGPASRPKYFIEWKPLHTIVSATVYAELKKSRREPVAGDTLLVAFGDPQYAQAASSERPATTASAALRDVLRGRYTLDPLPASRTEVSAIVAHYPGRARSYVGADATEERARTVGRNVRYIHFAAHGLLDERFPLNSALALTIPPSGSAGRDNGLLQAWEIFEYLRIDADLVTLSACDTALGEDMGGEGLVGLTRAFQYAGARSVLSSLWGVADDSTAELMTRVYGHLKAGVAKDEALRAAQRDLLRSTRFAHPFHWAAFTLAGDWR